MDLPANLTVPANGATLGLSKEMREPPQPTGTTSMQYDSIKIGDLSGEEIARWSELQRADPRFASPFLRPEFSQWIAGVRDDIRVVVLRDQGAAAGFFPFGRFGANAHPVGTPLASCQAVVAAAECRWDGLELLRATGLRRLTFDHWIPRQDELTPFCVVNRECPYLDLDDGFDAYLAAQKRQGSRLFAQIRHKRNRLRRELGEVRCERRVDLDALRQMIQWKSEQCRRTGVADLFQFDWPARVVTSALESVAPACQALLWGLYAHERLLAVNVLLRSHRHAHGWFMAFDSQYADYSPGMILLQAILRDLPELGIARLEMGQGADGYKTRLMTGVTFAREGVIDANPASRAAWDWWLRTRSWLRGSRLRPYAHRANRVLSNVRRLLGGNY